MVTDGFNVHLLVGGGYASVSLANDAVAVLGGSFDRNKYAVDRNRIVELGRRAGCEASRWATCRACGR
jgi:hypothetical protein